MFLLRAIQRRAVRFGIASGFELVPPKGWIKVTSRLNPFREYRSPDDRAHVRVIAWPHGAWETLARFEQALFSDGLLVDRRSEDRLSTGIPVVRLWRNSWRDERSGITYDWMDVLVLFDRPILFTLRSLPPSNRH